MAECPAAATERIPPGRPAATRRAARARPPPRHRAPARRRLAPATPRLVTRSAHASAAAPTSQRAADLGAHLAHPPGRITQSCNDIRRRTGRPRRRAGSAPPRPAPSSRWRRRGASGEPQPVTARPPTQPRSGSGGSPQVARPGEQVGAPGGQHVVAERVGGRARPVAGRGAAAPRSSTMRQQYAPGSGRTAPGRPASHHVCGGAPVVTGGTGRQGWTSGGLKGQPVGRHDLVDGLERRCWAGCLAAHAVRAVAGPPLVTPG